VDGGIVAARSRQRGREYFWKSLTPEGGMLLKISSARGPYLLETDTMAMDSTQATRKVVTACQANAFETPVWACVFLRCPK
jgi:hypothetical protein